MHRHEIPAPSGYKFDHMRLLAAGRRRERVSAGADAGLMAHLLTTGGKGDPERGTEIH